MFGQCLSFCRASSIPVTVSTVLHMWVDVPIHLFEEKWKSIQKKLLTFLLANETMLSATGLRSMETQMGKWGNSIVDVWIEWISLCSSFTSICDGPAGSRVTRRGYDVGNVRVFHKSAEGTPGYLLFAAWAIETLKIITFMCFLPFERELTFRLDLGLGCAKVAFNECKR